MTGDYWDLGGRKGQEIIEIQQGERDRRLLRSSGEKVTGHF